MINVISKYQFMRIIILLLAKSCLMMLEGMCYLSSILWWIMHYSHWARVSTDTFYWESWVLIMVCFLLGFIFTVTRYIIFDTLEELGDG